MSKRAILAVVLVFAVWNLLDFLIHGVVLMGTYSATASLWRPMEEMVRGVMMLVVAVHAILLVLLYERFVRGRGMATALAVGGIWGLAAGVGMAGSYAWMPIPGALAWAWLVGSTVEGLAAGAVLGLVVTEPGAAT